MNLRSGQSLERDAHTDSGSARVAVIGTGAIGTAVATAALGGGYTVRVWNRTLAATNPLLQLGVIQAPSPAAAVEHSDLVLVCLTDFSAARDVLAMAGVAPPGGRTTTVVTLTTGSPQDAAGMDEDLRARGFDYVDAGVQTAPEDIGTDRAVFLYSGSGSAFRRYREVLATLGTPRWLGEDVTAAATWDLALFGLWYDAQLGLLRAFDMLPDGPEARASFASAASQQLAHVVNATSVTATELGDRTYPRGPASVKEHLPVLRQLHAARIHNRFGDGGLATPLRLAEALQDAGHGGLGLTALADPDLIETSAVEPR